MLTRSAMDVEEPNVLAPRSTVRKGRKKTISYLWDRQTFGSRHSSMPSISRVPKRSNEPAIASAFAWNRRRLQNMILVVGPGTPASVLYGADGGDTSDSDDGGDTSASVPVQFEQENEEDEDDDESLSENHETGDEDEEEKEESSAEDDDERPRVRPYRRATADVIANADFRREALRMLRRRLRALGEGDDLIDSPRGMQVQHPDNRRRHQPSLRHGGCINTACWLDTPWRLSTVNEQAGLIHSVSALDSEECATQLLTSGDDRLVKVWDVTEAMGTTSPWSGGWDTFCPFAGDMPDLSLVKDGWKAKEDSRPGSVVNLTTVSSGHRGNVFHVTPIPTQPGKVLTCGADGYLRLCDLSVQQSGSRVVVHPYVEDDDDEMDLPFVLHSGMSFSHHLLSANTGLLCSERGLHHFDMRLSPREQSGISLLGRQEEDGDGVSFRSRSSPSSCKACAVWYPPSHTTTSPTVTRQLGDVESNYVFAGGSSAIVCLYDLRMGGTRSRVVERYKPRGLDDSGSQVSVSGLDVSKDGRELLVSYESDQIYSFPVGHEVSRYPTVEDVEFLCDTFGGSPESSLPELTCYGGHLNRFTFLKNARYAGPNDEYVCTGSDSGHAWIYERSSGTVAALLGADCCTCNGVIPHPNLPFFVTYGIDSTAKLWRASPPVDISTDDSPGGRAKCSLRQPYEMSPVAKTWDGVQTLLKHMDDEPAAMPDYIASSEEVAASGRFSSPCRRGICFGNDEAPRIGNAIQVLPSILRQNRYECYQAFHEELDVPVEHPVVNFSQRVSLARLRYQADRAGLAWDPWAPWALQVAQSNEGLHPAELVPDFPSDWINFDSNMKPDAMHPRKQFCLDEDPYSAATVEFHIPGFFDSTGHDGSVPWLQRREGKTGDEEAHVERCFEEKSRHLLEETASMLTDAGNVAVKEGLFDSAARRYDKAIQYCAVALMRYFDGGDALQHLTSGHHESISEEGTKRATSVIVRWSPLLHTLITSRLNMALLFLKPSFLHPGSAAGQARAALKLLSPFTVREGLVVKVRDKKEYVIREDEPPDTYREAKTLQAKAYYRLGWAELEAGDYAASIKNFEASLKCTPAGATSKPDSMTVKRLQEAKRKHKTKKKRDRAKFQRLHYAELSAEAQDGDERGKTSERSSSS